MRGKLRGPRGCGDDNGRAAAGVTIVGLLLYLKFYKWLNKRVNGKAQILVILAAAGVTVLGLLFLHF